MINLDENQKTKQDNDSTKESMSFYDRQRLVGAFAWLIQEDKKQNPELYQQWLGGQNNNLLYGEVQSILKDK